ncbi:aminotransferase class I/II-fold pyridoxal phosphate-dependent enzyme [Pullulanibacillus sp. KACC 23026]|uniref:aminotransferase class I/II-fold pyridoxal phosphate-dependent enzyme n=1 Tax=Pullulanibacillus sp. KACC 23026 TaxID=3028315 RepID=UPI0023B0FC69|nr:aminotransferase class I/II-fold pyridoxal phosphate-dependent enzyme [Pullulanibacillus sp. KACC 23026]WEG12996.1 aminotransferase class I/II-fold pyridoxal phosphate-dependent enzyme [Pullulanibacillus sp. KACC 23026]
MKFETLNLHTGVEVDGQTGAASVPIYQASTFHQFDWDQPPEFDYARSGNPTRQALEKIIAELEGGKAGFAFASGMAAITSVFLTLEAGSHVVACEDIYGGAFRALSQIFPRLGITTTFVDLTDLSQLEKAVRPETKAIYIETPSNPQLRVIDLKAVAQFAKEKGLLSIVDNTFMSPYLQNPHALGWDVVIHSATKFIGGHSDVVAGLVTVNSEELSQKVYQIQNGFGSILGVHDSWLVMRGIKTLSARMKQSQETAQKLAAYFDQHPLVKQVYYPGLAHHPGALLHQSQAKGPGAVLSFELESEEAVRRLVEHLRLPLFAVSLGAVESILSYPARMSHAAMPREERHARGISDGLLRLSVGLEDTDDLIADFDQALAAIAAAASTTK